MANFTRGPKPDTVAQFPTLKDQLLHKAYIMARCQARFRREEWELSETAYFRAWYPYWEQRGRTPQDMTLTRCDWDLPWTDDNIEVIPRSEFWQRLLELQAQNRGGIS